MDLLDKIVQYEIHTTRLPVCTVATDLLLCDGITGLFGARSQNYENLMLPSSCLSVCLSVHMEQLAFS